MSRIGNLSACCWAIVFSLFMVSESVAQDKSAAPNVSPEKQKLYDLFEKKLSNVQFKGNFTVLGREQKGDLPKETYTIKSVKKLSEGEYWLFTARVQYGGKDITVPMSLQVQWADTTPVITLTNANIPGLGTFSSRVVIYKNKYAGTWSHGEVGGHLFGTIEPVPAESEEKDE
ncbi:MAG: hypothetical protein ACJZ8Y_03420 [Pirellulaceae bacterium]|jgi:hypothetical protein|nr:hypothetical protein [Pirellulaceae bacterium]|tara:strand:+ start:858 stop:1376 length:519 start_codon:yes stop_codon:yes gene_type:complete